MRTLSRGASALVVLMAFASCNGLLKKETAAVDASEEASVVETLDAAPLPAPAALATNEGDVARFPDEEKLPDLKATTLRPYSVREAPPAGAVVTGLAKGTTVTQIGRRERYLLIVFEDPKRPGEKLMGWVARDAFSAVVPDAGPPVCPPGEIALSGDTPFCGKTCKTDVDCPSTPTKQACKGEAHKLLPSGKAGERVTVCTLLVQTHDAGASPQAASLDAGKPSAPSDAGSVPLAASTGDGGIAPPPVDAATAP